MLKCQFLFSAVFGFKNPSNEIFSESDEINAQVPIFPGTIQNTREPPEGSPGGPTPHPGAARWGRAALWCGGPRPPPKLPFRLFKASVAKTLLRRTKPTETFQSRRHREAKIWGTGVSVPAPCRSGEVPTEGFSIDTAAISTDIFITAVAPMKRE